MGKDSGCRVKPVKPLSICGYPNNASCINTNRFQRISRKRIRILWIVIVRSHLVAIVFEKPLFGRKPHISLGILSNAAHMRKYFSFGWENFVKQYFLRGDRTTLHQQEQKNKVEWRFWCH